MPGDLEAEKETWNVRASSRNRDGGEKDMRVSADHKALPTMLERSATWKRTLLRKLTWLVKRVFLRARCDAPKMRFHSKHVKIVPWTPAFTGLEQCAIIECFLCCDLYCSSVGRLQPSSSLQSVWLSHCSTIDSVMLPCDPLPCLHCRSGEGLMSSASGTDTLSDNDAAGNNGNLEDEMELFVNYRNTFVM